MLSKSNPFSVYRESDGVVVNSGFASSPSSLAAQAGPGELVYVGEALEKGSRILSDRIERFVPEEPPVTVSMIKDEQGRRLRYTDWYVTRAADPTDARPVPIEIVAEREAIRAAAHRLEAMNPIPQDYREPKYWLASFTALP